MSLADNYYNIYLAIVSVLSFSLFSRYRAEDRSVPNNSASILLLVFMILFIGLRPVSGRAFGDMSSYKYVYESYLGAPFHFEWNTTNKLFDNFIPFLGSLNFSSTFFFVIISFFYFVLTFLGCKLLFNEDYLMVFVMWLGAFSTFSYGTNGIKAGFAASLFYVALGLVYNKKKISTLLFLALSLGIHHSMILPIMAFFIAYFYKNDKVYIILWIFSFLMALLHITYFQHLFGGFTDEQGAGYLLYGDGKNVKTSMLGGFRIDFILYGAVPIFFGWYAKYKYQFHSDFYNFLLNTYTLCNAIWMLCMYAEFTNRIAYLSWFMYPIVLAFPLFSQVWKDNQHKLVKTVAYGHLAFTLFMYLIYY